MLHFYGCPACKAPLAMASTLLRYAVIQSGQCPLCGCRFRTMTPLRLTLITGDATANAWRWPATEINATAP
jgi:hypothetical protein